MTLPTHVIAVGGLVRNAEGLILLVRHPRRGWEFPGGMAERGESLPQALEREVLEESGIVVEAVRLAGLYSNTATREGYNGVEEIPPILNIDFHCAYVSGEPRPSEESLDVGWFTSAQALDMVTHPLLAFRLRKLLEASDGIPYCAFTLPFDILESRQF